MLITNCNNFEIFGPHTIYSKLASPSSILSSHNLCFFSKDVSLPPYLLNTPIIQCQGLIQLNFRIMAISGFAVLKSINAWKRY